MLAYVVSIGYITGVRGGCSLAASHGAGVLLNQGKKMKTNKKLSNWVAPVLEKQDTPARRQAQHLRDRYGDKKKPQDEKNKGGE
jgi:hypothetical protein|tara:strand:- start:449 stop:700 length:252 start_codon:yes stop_codon:yes gene_type:complete